MAGKAETSPTKSNPARALPETSLVLISIVFERFLQEVGGSPHPDRSPMFQGWQLT